MCATRQPLPGNDPTTSVFEKKLLKLNQAEWGLKCWTFLVRVHSTTATKGSYFRRFELGNLGLDNSGLTDFLRHLLGHIKWAA